MLLDVLEFIPFYYSPTVQLYEYTSQFIYLPIEGHL